MKIGNFIKTLVPSFKKKNLLEDLDRYKEEMTTINLPQIEASAEFFRNWRFKDARVKQFDSRFTSEVSSRTRGNFVVVLAAITRQVEETIDAVYHLMKSELSDNLITDAITYRKANLLQLSECIGLFLRFERTLLLWTYSNETNAITGAHKDHALSKGQIEWMNENMPAFFLACNVLSKSKSDIQKDLDGIPDAVYTDGNDEIIESTMGAKAIDPFRFAIVGTTFNIFYHARMMVADWQMSRYHAAKEEQRALSYRLLNLKELAAGRSDPKLQLEISEVEGRLSSLNASIAKKEEEYAK